MSAWDLSYTTGLRYHGRVTSEGRSPRHAQHQLELGHHLDQPRQQEGAPRYAQHRLELIRPGSPDVLRARHGKILLSAGHHW